MKESYQSAHPHFAPGTKAYAYIRFSSMPQERGDSVNRQTTKSVDYANTHGLDLSAIDRYQDLGRSGYTGSNVTKGKLGEFLAEVRAGRITSGSVLLVESLDRISRQQVTEAYDTFRDIIKSGITIVTLLDGQVYSPEVMASPNAMIPMLMSLLTMSRAHEESLIKSVRVKKAWEAKRSRMKDEKLTATCPQWMELAEDRKSFKLIDENVSIVKRIIDLQMKGVGQSVIVKTLNAEGVPVLNYRYKRRGTTYWHESTIHKILTSTALYGEYQRMAVSNGTDPSTGDERNFKNPVGEPIADYYPPIMTKEEFLALQAVRRERAKKGRGSKGSHFTSLFSGLLRCGYCGHSMIISAYSNTRTKDIKRSIVCSGAKRGLGCHFVMWDYDNFERTIMAYLKDVDFSGLIDDSKSLAKEIQMHEARVTSLDDDAKKLQQRLGRLYDALEEGEILASLKNRICMLEEEQRANFELRQVAERELNAAKNRNLDATVVYNSIVDLYSKMESTSEQDRFILRAQIASEIRRVVSKIAVFPGGTHLLDDPDDDGFDRNEASMALLQGALARLKAKVSKTPFELSKEAEIRQRVREGARRRVVEGISNEELALEMDHLRRELPDKSFRTARIYGVNGQCYATPTLIDALLNPELSGPADLMACLGMGVQAQRKERERASMTLK